MRYFHKPNFGSIIPNLNITFWCGVFVLYLILTIFPGITLWVCSLGGFKYWALTNDVLNYSIDKHIKFCDQYQFTK